MYALFLHGHSLRAAIGIHDFERAEPQRLVLNIDLALRALPSGETIEAVLDYDFLRDAAAQIARDGHIDLQETFCTRLLDVISAKPEVAAARVSTQKPDVYPDTEAVGCRMLYLADGADLSTVLALWNV